MNKVLYCNNSRGILYNIVDHEGNTIEHNKMFSKTVSDKKNIKLTKAENDMIRGHRCTLFAPFFIFIRDVYGISNQDDYIVKPEKELTNRPVYPIDKNIPEIWEIRPEHGVLYSMKQNYFGNDFEILLAWFWDIYALKNRQVRLAYLYGHGREGKSLISNVFREILSETMCLDVNSADLMKEFGTAGMEGKILILATENDSKKIFDSSRMKALTDDRIGIRDLYISKYWVKNHTNILMTSNQRQAYMNPFFDAEADRVLPIRFLNIFDLSEHEGDIMEDIINHHIPTLLSYAKYCHKMYYQYVKKVHVSRFFERSIVGDTALAIKEVIIEQPPITHISEIDGRIQQLKIMSKQEATKNIIHWSQTYLREVMVGTLKPIVISNNKTEIESKTSLKLGNTEDEFEDHIDEVIRKKEQLREFENE